MEPSADTCWCTAYVRNNYPHIPGCPNAGKGSAELLADMKRLARKEAFEEAAQVVEQCNREGPYNAIGAAPRIRRLGDGEGDG